MSSSTVLLHSILLLSPVATKMDALNGTTKIVEIDSPVSRFGPYLTGPNLAGGLAIAFLVQFIYQIVYYRYFHPLKDFDGPFWGSVTRLWHTYQNIRGIELETYDRLLKEKNSMYSH